jgi:pyrroline-5-carboxylate reductase
MPNTPALLRKGISAISTGRFSGSKDIEFAGKIMSGTGDCIIIDEKLQNAVTAVSGSGPAYFFLFCGEIIETAVKLGIDRKTAQKLVFATMRGSADMLEAYNGDTDFLIKMVRSPGGTTEAAMDVFLKNNFGKIVAEAVENAEQKAGRIQKGLENNN